MVPVNRAEPALLDLLRTRALKRGPKMKLASGLESDVFVNCKAITLHGPSLWSMSRWLVERLRALDPEVTHCAGVSVGGDPIVAGMIAYAHRELDWSLEALLVRKQPKDHGASAGRATEGAAAEASQRIWLVEDVISTGGSALVAAEHLKREGYRLSGVLTIVDREMGGDAKVADALKVPVVSLARISELL